ncbi:protein of unknown function [Nitrospira defluvii]|uniref:Uncharacterized protein n=1 Tax=Nitrospira defluvii TaxID=330214 RepID=D8PIL5_9BACT|nr:protein of unknown function [Nitrospira defluvii]
MRKAAKPRPVPLARIALAATGTDIGPIVGVVGIPFSASLCPTAATGVRHRLVVVQG